MSKVASIGDLMTPLTSINSCMDSNVSSLVKGISDVNTSVLDCREALKSATDTWGKKIDDGNGKVILSLKELTEVAKKSATASMSGSGATSASIAGLGTSINGGLQTLSGIGIGIGQSLEAIDTSIHKLKNFLVLKYFLSERKANKQMAKGGAQKAMIAPPIKLPKIENADSVGKGIDVMVNAVKRVSKMSLIELIKFKPKMRLLIKSIEAPSKQFQKSFKPGEIKNIGNSLQSLAKGLNDYISIIGNVIENSKKVSGIGKDYKSSALYKVLNSTINATILGVFGGTYNPQTNKIVGKDTKRLSGLKVASKELTALGLALSSYAKNMKNVGMNAMIASIFFNKNPLKSSLYKLMNGVVVAIMTTMYGSKYNSATNTLTAGSPKRMSELNVGIKALKHLGNNVLIFERSLAKAMAFTPFAFLATLLFEKTARNVKRGIDVFVGRATPVEIAAKKYKIAGRAMRHISKDIMMFDLALSTTLVTAPLAFVGTLILGATVGNIKKAKRKLFGKSPALIAMFEYKTFGKTLKEVGKDILLFNLALSLTAVTAPLALVGALMLPLIMKGIDLSKRILFGKEGSIVGGIAYDRFGRTLKKLGKNILKFEVAMALSAVVAPAAMVGIAMFALLMLETRLVFNRISRPKNLLSFKSASRALRQMAWSILAFEVSMVFSTILAPVAAIGLIGASALLIGAAKIFDFIGKPKVRKNIAFGALGLQLIAITSLGFLVSLVLSAMIVKSFLVNDAGKLDPTNIIAFAGALASFGLMVGAFYVFKHIGKMKNVKSVILASASIMLMSLSMIMFSVSMLVGSMVTKQILGNSLKSGKLDVTDVASLAGTFGLFFLMIGAHYVFKKIGKTKNVKSSIQAGVAIICMSVGFILFSLSLWVADKFTRSMYKTNGGKFDVMAVVNQVIILALMMGSLTVFSKIGTNKSVKDSFRGLIAIACMSAGFILFSGAIWVADKIIGTMWKTSGGGTDWMAMLKTVAVFGMMIGGVYLYDFAGKRLKNVAKGFAAILLVSIGIGAFGVGIKYYVDAVKDASTKTLVAMPLLMGAFLLEFVAAGKFLKDIAKGMVAIGLMSGALALFGMGVKQYIDPMKDIKWMTILQMITLLGAFGLEFAGLGMLMTQIIMGDVAIGIMGPALASFGWGVSKYVEPMADMKWSTIGKMAALIGIFGAEFAALGPLAIGIVASDVAFGIMGPCLTSFGKGLAEFMKPIHDLKPNTIKEMAKVIGVLGGEFALLGLAAISIGAADLAIGGMGKSLSALGSGLKDFVPPIKDIKQQQVKMMGNVIRTLTDAFKDVGVIGSIPVKKGADAMIPAAFAIRLLAGALQEWAKVSIDQKQLDMLCVSIDRIKLAFQGQPKGKEDTGKGIRGFFKKIGNSVSNAITAPFDKSQIQNTASALSVAAIAIKVLSKSLQEWQNVSMDEDSLNMLCLSVDRLKIAFGSVPKEKRKLPGLLGKLGVTLDVPINLNAIRTTATGLAVAGVAIKSLAKGLAAWTESDFDIDDMSSFTIVALMMKDTFALLSSAGAEQAKYMKDVLGYEPSTFTPEDAGKGADFAKKMGSALIDITRGIVSFKNDFGKEFGDPKFIEEFATSVANIVTSLTTAFADIGRLNYEVDVQPAKTGFARLWQKITGPLGKETKNYVTEGINSIKDLGTTIKNLAEGLKSMKNLVPKASDTGWLAEVGKNLSAVLTALYVPLSKFGTTDESWDFETELATNGVKKIDGALKAVANSAKSTMNFNHHKVDIMAAMKNIGSLGDFIKSTAEGLKTISEMDTKTIIGEGGIVNEQFQVIGGSGVIGNTQNLMCAIMGVLVQLGTYMEKSGTYDDIVDKAESTGKLGLFSSESSKSKNYSKTTKSYLGLAIDAVSKIGGIMTDIADGMKEMNSVYDDPSEMVSGTLNIMKGIIIMTSMLGNVGECARDGKTRNLTSNAMAILPGIQAIYCDGNIKRIVDGTVDFDGIFDSIKNVANNMGGAFKSLKENSDFLKTFYENPAQFMLPVVDIIEMVSAFVPHDDEIKYIVRGSGVSVSYILGKLGKDSFKTAESNATNMSKFAKNVKYGIDYIASSKDSFKFVYENAESVILGIANITSMVGIIGDHSDKSKSYLYSKGNIVTYEMGAFGAEKAKSASTNAAYINKVAKELAPAMASISGMPKNAGDVFEKFATQLTNGMTKLSTVSNIKNATNFINALTNAKNKGTFESLSTNTKKIANAINQINNDIMTPYAEMIGALRDLMHISSSKRDQLYNELYELVEKIITAINEGHKPVKPQTSQQTNNNKNYNNSNSNPAPRPSAPVKTTAKLEGVDTFKNAVAALVKFLNSKGITVSNGQ